MQTCSCCDFEVSIITSTLRKIKLIFMYGDPALQNFPNITIKEEGRCID
jgi:hypothetical protein